MLRSSTGPGTVAENVMLINGICIINLQRTDTLGPGFIEMLFSHREGDSLVLGPWCLIERCFA